MQTIAFPDHHAFSEKNIAQIVGKWNDISSSNKILLTTEKDAMRLQQIKIPEPIVKHSYYIPVEVDFTENGKILFEQKLEKIA